MEVVFTGVGQQMEVTLQVTVGQLGDVDEAQVEEKYNEVDIHKPPSEAEIS